MLNIQSTDAYSENDVCGASCELRTARLAAPFAVRHTHLQVCIALDGIQYKISSVHSIQPYATCSWFFLFCCYRLSQNFNLQAKYDRLNKK